MLWHLKFALKKIVEMELPSVWRHFSPLSKKI